MKKATNYEELNPILVRVATKMAKAQGMTFDQLVERLLRKELNKVTIHLSRGDAEYIAQSLVNDAESDCGGPTPDCPEAVFEKAIRDHRERPDPKDPRGAAINERNYRVWRAITAALHRPQR